MEQSVTSQNPQPQPQEQQPDKFNRHNPPDKSNPEDVYNYVARSISGPSFRNPLKNFIDENCITFIDIEENTFEQGQLFKEMNLLLENLLDDVLKEGQLSQEDFLKAAERGLEDKKYKKYFNQVINFGDYNFFKNIMTKRNYQIIKMAEQEMQKANNPPSQEQQEEIPKIQEPKSEEVKAEEDKMTRELVRKMLEEESKELDEAIKQSLAEEEERRRIAVIEEEEIRRALKNSLQQTKNETPKVEEPKPEETKKEEPKKEEPKKEEPKKEEPKKEEPKKFVPVISTAGNFQFSGLEKPKEEPKPPEKKPEKTQFSFQPSSVNNIQYQIQSNPIPPITQPKPEEKKEEIKPKEDIQPKKDIKTKDLIDDEPTKEEPKNEINEKEEEIKPKQNERITREFVNVFDEKKKTLKPLNNKPRNFNNINLGPSKNTLLQDLQKKKGTIKEDIERMNIKKENKQKIESATEILKKNMEKNKQDMNDIINVDNDGLLIDDDDNEEDDKNEYFSKHNIQFGKIEIPSNFNGKIPEYTKEKQEELKEFRDMVIKQKVNNRENNLEDI